MLSPAGAGLGNAIVTVVNAGTGQSKTVRTNAMGVFRAEDLGVGQIYLVTVNHKAYRFPTDPTIVNLSDSVTGLTFTGQLPEMKAAGSR